MTTTTNKDAPAEHAGKLIVRLPFEGFYESRWSGEVDHVEEMEAEHMAEREREEQPPELRLSANDFGEMLYRFADYGAIYQAVARVYVDAFDHVVSEALGLPLGLAFERMTSPREYNFETDRVFAYIAPEVVEGLFRRSAADGHKVLGELIRDRFTSCSGFSSHYSNTLDVWLDRPVLDWDHNELETLLLACIQLAGDAAADWEWSVFYFATDGDGLWSEWSGGFDWPAFEAAREELRDEKRDAWAEDHQGERLPPPRCPFTLDMFTRRPG